MTVEHYLAEASRHPWRWGGGADGFSGDDCTLFVANWALALTGEDPGVGIRGSYSTDEEAHAIVARAGGFEAFVDRQLRGHGWIRTRASPRDGDIGVVLAPLPPKGEPGPVPAIRSGGMWVGRALRGQVAYRFEAVSVWRWNAAPLADLGPPEPRFAPPPSRQMLAGETALSPVPRQMQQGPIVSSLIVAGLGSLGVSAGAASFLAPILTGIAMTGISLGINALFAPEVPKPPKPEDGRAPIMQALPPVIYAVGRNRIGGYAMLHEAKNDRFYNVNALVGHRIEGFVGYYLNDDEVTVDFDPNEYWPSMGSVEKGDDDRYGPRVAIDTRVGETPETAYADFVTDLSGEGVWTANHRGDGIASIAIACRAPTAENYQKIFPNGAPQPSAVLETARIWDFRDEDQDPEDPETWTYSENAVLQTVWHYCFNPYYGPLDYTRAVLPNIERLKEEADICDEAVALAAGGTEPRYAAHIWSTTERDPKAFTNALLNAGDIWLAQRGDGALDIVAGKFREDLVVTVTDEDIAGYYLQNDVEEENEINQLVPKFTYPATGYTATDTDAFDDTEAQATAGRVLRDDCDLSGVQSWRQARRLGKREWARLQMKRRGSLDLRLSGINAAYARWVRIESTYRVPRLNGVLIENRRSVLALMKGGFSMEFVEHPEDIDAWDPEADEGAAPPVPAKPSNSDVETATIDTLTAMTGAGGVYLRIVVVQPISDDLIPIVRYRLKDAGGGSPGQWIEQAFPDAEPAGGLIALDTNPVIGDEVYQVQAGFKATGGTKSAWAPLTPDEVTATIDAVAPADLIGFAAADGVGQFVVSFSAANDPHLVSVAIYRVPSGGVLNRVTHEVARPAVAAGVSYNLSIASSAGAFDIYAEPLNGSGIAGTLEGPDAATVT